MSGEAEHRTKVLRVATRCTSLDQFVEAFARYCEKRTLFIASMSTRAPGTQSPFVILLSDGAQALRGTCEVVDAWATPSGPFRRPGVRVKFLQLDAASESVLVRLHKFKPPPPPQPKPPVLPPLPGIKTQIGMPPKTPAPGTPVVAAPPTVPTSVPAVLAPLSRATVRVQAVPPPTATGLPPLSKPATPPAGTAALTPPVIPPRATPPTGSATSTTRMAGLARPESTPVPELVPQARTPSNVPEPVDAPYEDRPPEPDPDDAKTDVVGDAEALRAIREGAPTDPPPMRLEERAPGSPIILPANPLAEITDDSLRGFVECTLFEETGQFKFDDLLDRAGTDGDLEDPIAEPPSVPDLRASLPPELKPNPRRDQTPVPQRAQPAAAVDVAKPPFEENDDGEPIPIITGPPVPHTPPPSVLGPIPGGSVMPMPQAPQAMFGDLAMPPAAGATPIATPPVYVAPPPPPVHPSSASVDDDLVPPKRNLLFIALGAAAIIIAVVVIVLIVNSGSKSEANVAGKKPDTLAKTGSGKKPPDTLAGSAKPGSTSGSESASGSDTGSESGSESGSGAGSDTASGAGSDTASGAGSDTASGTGPAAGSDSGSETGAGELTAADRLPAPVGDCSANIVSVPSGALVRANGRYYGETPLQAALPCGRVTLSIAYRRYATVEKTISFSADKPADLRFAMERPRHKVKIVSTPGGATVTVNGSKIGTTPLTASLPGYSMLTIEMRRAGFKTYRGKHYSKRNGEVVAARLEKGR